MGHMVKRVLALLLAGILPVLISVAHAMGFEAETIYESVVVISSGGALGSGFALGENCVVSNAHVVNDPQNVLLVTYGGEEYHADVVVMDSKLDIAILRLDEATFRCLHVADENGSKIGDEIYTVGAPSNLAYTLTKGIISAIERKIGANTYIQVDAPVNAGNSGGPLLNDKGEVLGVNTLKVSGSEGIGLSIPQ
jgi:serine protease Do